MRATRALSRASRDARCSGVTRGLALLLLALDQHVEEGRRSCARICLEGRGAVLADEVVGVEPVGQEGELHAEAGLQVRQHRLDRPEGGPAAGGVAVEAQDRLGRHAPQQLHLVLGQRRAERRHGLREARLAPGR